MQQILRTVGAFAFLFVFVANALAAAEPLLLSEIGSERATTGPGNNIVTVGEKTHVVWQDSETKGYVNRVRSLDRKTGEWSPAVTLGPGVDNHARPTITADSHGYLHVVLSGHNTMMYHRRSVEPSDSSKWTKPTPIDVGTYPMLVCGPGDALVVGARPRPHDGVNLYVLSNGDDRWQTRKLVLKRPKPYTNYGAYNVALAWGSDGALHFAADTYVGRNGTTNRGTYQSIVYMKTRDLGVTWTKADGTTLGGQVELTEPDILAKFDAGLGGPAQDAQLRNGGIVIDSDGRPLVYFTEKHEGRGRARLMTCDAAGVWRDLPLADAFTKQWPDAEALGARGHLSLTKDGALYVLVEFAPVPPPGKTFARFERTLAVGLLTSRDGGETFAARDVLPLDTAHHYTQASLERPTGVGNLDQLPSLIVTDGEQRYPAKGEVIDTRVLWLQP